MLEIRGVSKVYNTGGLKQKALDSISINFRESEFAAILGPSGSGKTTFLNIIGGLDHYDSGDLEINEISTKKFKDRDWDSYRNHRIGFVFQSYNLIGHQSILANVRLALTVSGISKKESITRAKKALKDVGLEQHIHKKPSQLSGGQMQRVAIARALVNNPDILLADEPTGALDSETSVQIMKLLKNISKDKLVIMVTHNPDLANKYATRIITLKDGRITSDSNPYDGEIDTKKSIETNRQKTKKTSMSFLTALSLSFNNLLTKKARTILVALAGSIGIIGIALILAVSTGFQNYVDSIQESTLSSYPLTIFEQSADLTSLLLGMTKEVTPEGDHDVAESQLLTSLIDSVGSNDLKSFKQYYESHQNEVESDLLSTRYTYSVDPPIYTIDAANHLAKLNPNRLFDTIYGSSNLFSSYTSMASVFMQITDDEEMFKSNYQIVAGRYPSRYDEVILILPNDHEISDFLVYSLGLRDTDKLNTIVNKFLANEPVTLNNTPKNFSYEELMQTVLKLIQPSDLYKYNSKYDVYEDMSDDNEYMMNLYQNAEQLKIVGIASIGDNAMNEGGVGYLPSLIQHVIQHSATSKIVQKQLSNPEIDVVSGTRFDAKRDNYNFQFSDLVSIDDDALQEAFGVKIDQNAIQAKTVEYITEATNSISTDVNPAKNAFNDTLSSLINGTFNSIENEISLNDTEAAVNSYLGGNEATAIINSLSADYVVPATTFKQTFAGMITPLVKAYIGAYANIDPSHTTEPTNPVAVINEEVLPTATIINPYLDNAAIVAIKENFAKVMTEAKIKKTIAEKMSGLTAYLTTSFASAFSVDQNKLISAFKLNFTEDELARVVTAMFTNTASTLSSNLIAFGYQDLESPTAISFYFTSFDGKEHFINWLDNYNQSMEQIHDDNKVIRYSDTTGILMSSVKTIVDAVSYVLIAFVSISLVVSSIMIGVITYISVYERTKEIGILRSIGASKHNISSIFNAETFIIGLLSGLLGIGISYALIPIINAVLHHYTGDIPLSAALNPMAALRLVILSVILTIIGGLIPARKASKRDPVEALRSE